jgi:superfamily I DNA and/or RNA helicase
LSKLLEIRIYHEVTKYEDECKDELSKIVDFANITARISRYKNSQLEVSASLCEGKSSRDYDNLYANAENNKDYLYQISKKQKFWPIRKTMEVYGEFILSLFPCWLLSPDNVSALLPLTKNLFDLVIFDEASQVFIESTIPAIYRGKNIVVAGDAKQLRPSTTFMKRYLGADPEAQEDYSVQAALEVESLLDLAVARYDSANLTYHYRSKNQELIDFSNHAFYGMKLQIAPNISKNTSSESTFAESSHAAAIRFSCNSAASSESASICFFCNARSRSRSASEFSRLESFLASSARNSNTAAMSAPYLRRSFAMVSSLASTLFSTAVGSPPPSESKSLAVFAISSTS